MYGPRKLSYICGIQCMRGISDVSFYWVEKYYPSSTVVLIIERLFLFNTELFIPFQLPLIMPIILFIWTLIIVALTIYQQPTESLIGMAIFASAIPVYIVGVVWTNKPKSVTDFSGELFRFLFHRDACTVRKRAFL